jgi:uncharacterized membrane protein YdjX (TVP38/TMEM64 family)
MSTQERPAIVGNRKNLFIIGILGIVFVAGLWVWKSGLTILEIKNGWAALNQFLAVNPFCLFMAIVILPGLPFPMSALLFSAGVVWRDQPVTACLLSMLAMALNLTWTYWLAARFGRSLVEKVLATAKVKIPELPVGDHVRLILVLKLTPGIPFFFQNYLLGFLRTPFRLYLPISLFCNGVIGIGIVLSGVGLSNGQLIPIITGASLIAVSLTLIQFVRGRLARKDKLK